MKQLIAYLLDHAILDFSGDLTLDMVRDFLRDDDDPESRKLLAKVVADRGVEDMIVTDSEGNMALNEKGLSREAMKPLSQVSVTHSTGKNKGKQVNIKTVSTAEKTAALVQIGKHLGMFKEKVEVSTDSSLLDLVTQSFKTEEPIS